MALAAIAELVPEPTDPREGRVKLGSYASYAVVAGMSPKNVAIRQCRLQFLRTVVCDLSAFKTHDFEVC